MGHKARRTSSETPEEYFARAPDWQQELVALLQRLVMRVVPDAKLVMKWGAPVFALREPFAYLGCFSKTVNLGFLHGASLDDPGGLLEGAGKEGRHLRFRSPDDIVETPLRALIRQAAEHAR